MSLVPITLTIPTNDTPTAAQYVGTVGAPMTLALKGVDTDSIAIDVAATALAFDSANWIQLCIANVGPSGSAVKNAPDWKEAYAQLPYWRIRRLNGTSAMVGVLSGPPNTQSTGPAGAPSSGYANVAGGTVTLDPGAVPAPVLVAATPSIGNGSYLIQGAMCVYDETDLSNRSFYVAAAFKVAGGTASAIGAVAANGLGEAMAVTVTHDVSGINLGIYATGITGKVIRASFAGVVSMVA